MQAKIPPLVFDESQLGCKSLFLDSGAFAFWDRSTQWGKENKCDRFLFFEQQEFWDYVDSYAAFVKKYAIAIDHYSNVDVIPHPKLSWRVQKYLEDTHKLKPIPVVHYPTPLKWLEKHLAAGYDYIGIGGLVGHHSQDVCRDWIDRVFDMICKPSPQRHPTVKLHGFGMTSWELLLRFPWWSVDSAYWTKQGGFGRILIPHRRKGQFIFNEQPYSVPVSDDASERPLKGRHYSTMSGAERAVIDSWLWEVQVPMGVTGPAGEIIEMGCRNHHSPRKANNLFFFDRLLKSLPTWPWSFTGLKHKKKSLFEV